MKKVKDYYFKKAKKEGFAARSVYKLKEAQEKFHFIKKEEKVLDLGAYPGSWTRYASQVVGPKGLVIAVDINPLDKSSMGGAENIIAITEDVFQLNMDRLKEISPFFHVVLSDMAPKTTGNKMVDQARSIALAERALEIALQVLVPEGSFFCKVFQGSDFPSFLKTVKDSFKEVRIIKPKSSRAESVEIFLLGRERKASLE